jgi:hypothetical protein
MDPNGHLSQLLKCAEDGNGCTTCREERGINPWMESQQQSFNSKLNGIGLLQEYQTLTSTIYLFTFYHFS